MKKTGFLSLIILCFFISSPRVYSSPDFSHSHIRIKHPPPIHLNHLAVDLIDIARIELDSGENHIAVINDLVQRLGDHLSTKGYQVLETPGLPAMPLSKDGSVKYAYGNWLVKVAEATGVRLLETRIKPLEEQLLQTEPWAVVSLPFRFIIFPDQFFGQSFIHICLVDPLAYTTQFFEPGAVLKELLLQARTTLIEVVGEAFPEAYFDPQRPPSEPERPAEPPLLQVAEVEIGPQMRFASLEAVVSTIQQGDLVLFRGTPEEHSYSIGGPLPDYEYLRDDTASYLGFLRFPRFLSIKDGWIKKDGKKVYFPEWKLPNKSDRMFSLISHGVFHVYGKTYDDPMQRLGFDTPAGSIYVLQVWDSYHPFLIHSGVWHFAALPVSVFFCETAPDRVGIFVQNPVFVIKRYFADVPDDLLRSFKAEWDANPKNKTYWPDMSKGEMAEFILNKITERIREALR